MTAQLVWHRFDGISPAGTQAVGGWGISPFPPLRPSDTAVMDAIGVGAVQMRSPVEVVCRTCGEWLLWVNEFADATGDCTGAIAVVRQGPNHAFYVPLDESTPASLAVWCPNDVTVAPISSEGCGPS